MKFNTSILDFSREHILLQLPSPNKESSMPSAAELERFFAAAEKYEQKRFAQKCVINTPYNHYMCGVRTISEMHTVCSF